MKVARGPSSSSLSSASLRLRWTWLIRLMGMGLRRRRVTVVAGCGAFTVAALALFAAFGYLSLARSNTAGSRATKSAMAGQRVELVAFLRDDLPASSRDGLSAVLSRLPGVAGVRLLGSDEALARLRGELGERAAVLDGVEEGFLPATLEVALQPGSQGSERADALAWRLRRMDGITDVDVLRSAEDERLAHAEQLGRRLGQGGLTLALAALVLALGLAALALRRPSAEARLMTGLGFTASAVAGPAALAGALCALAGVAAAALLGLLAARFLTDGLLMGGWTSGSWSAQMLGWAPAGAPGARWLLGALAMMVAAGAALGWWGARPSHREVDEVAAGA